MPCAVALVSNYNQEPDERGRKGILSLSVQKYSMYSPRYLLTKLDCTVCSFTFCIVDFGQQLPH